jgi:hypothetical protein
MADIEFDAGLFLAACTCVSSEETRRYLQGVFVTPAPDPATGRGVLMVATDGHRMALVYDAEGIIDRGRIIKLDPKHKALKAGRGEAGRVLHIDGLNKGGSAVARVLLGFDSDCTQVDVVTVSEIDGDFPDWTRVLPEAPTEGIAMHAGNSFNPEYLAGFGKAFKALTGHRIGSFSIAQPAAGAPAWIWNDTTPHVRFVCMPMRCAVDPGRPHWITQATAQH